MILLRRAAGATACAIEFAALLVGKLLLAGLEAGSVAGLDQATAHLAAPCSIAANLRERVAHRGQLVGDRMRHRLVELGAREVVASEVEEARGDRAARRVGVTAAAARRRERQRR